MEFQRGQIVRDGYDLGKMDEVLAQDGILRTSHVGEATIINAKLRDIYDRTLKHLQQDVGFLLTRKGQTSGAGGTGCLTAPGFFRVPSAVNPSTTTVKSSYRHRRVLSAGIGAVQPAAEDKQLM